ncbi:carotenoid biosynthesis protein [Promicromonospora sp. NPDC019610]|uniref:carotenoid biosynthesis protein n=1 Tax=Promicromonospora sp. NPDC019610 TaxID=3364405 RepID=UPI0037984D11
MTDTISRGTNVDVVLTPGTPARRSDGRVRQALGWVVVAIAAAAAVVVPLTGAPAATQVIAVLGVTLALVQGTRRYGWGTLLAFFAISYSISFMWENLSVMTGFPFGNYHYTLLPQLFYVPVIIGVAYFGIGYVSWMTANTILDRADERLNLRTRTGRINVIALPVLAGATMTMFDVGIDSIASTVRQTWIWEQGGGVFGVPFTNYLGWWFVTWTFFQVFALVVAARQTRRGEEAATLPAVSFLQHALVFLMFGISSVSAFFGYTEGDTIIDATGTSWSTPAIFETLMVFNLFSIIPVSLFAIAKIARGDLDRA